MVDSIIFFRFSIIVSCISTIFSARIERMLFYSCWHSLFDWGRPRERNLHLQLFVRINQTSTNPSPSRIPFPVPYALNTAPSVSWPIQSKSPRSSSTVPASFGSKARAEWHGVRLRNAFLPNSSPSSCPCLGQDCATLRWDWGSWLGSRSPSIPVSCLRRSCMVRRSAISPPVSLSSGLWDTEARRDVPPGSLLSPPVPRVVPEGG